MPIERCLDHCIHYDIDDELLEQALWDEEQMTRQKGINNPTTLTLNERMDFVGSLAHNAVFAVLDMWNIAFDRTPFFDPNIHKDDWDFMYAGSRCDIQGRSIGTWQDGTPITKVYPKTRLHVKNQKKQKPMDYYVLCVVDVPSSVVHIVGVTSYSELWHTLGEEAIGKNPHHFMRASQMKSFRNFIYRV